MGRNAKRKKDREYHLPTITLPPDGDYLYGKDGQFTDGRDFSIDIVKSSRTGRYLVCLDPNPSSDSRNMVTLTVWDTLERAFCGGDEALNILGEYSYKKLCDFQAYQGFISRLSDDDDQVVVVVQDGKIYTDIESRMTAMKEANKLLIARNARVRFRVEGETVI